MDYLSLSETFGWTPKEIDEQDPHMLEAYRAILSGRGKNQPEPKQMKRKIKGMM